MKQQEKDSFLLNGDIMIKFKQSGFLQNTEFCRIQFNPSFIQRGNYIRAGKMELSPEDIRKDKGKQIPNDFKVLIYFEDICKTCNPQTTEIANLCNVCK